jgi:hypothetical protein
MDWIELDKTRDKATSDKIINLNPLAMAVIYLADVVRYCFSDEAILDEEEEM